METKKEIIIPVIIVRIISIILLPILLYLLWTQFLFVRIGVTGRKMSCVENYKEYYYKTEIEYKSGFLTNGKEPVRIIYFLPGQRNRMMKKIKEDVIYLLDELIEKYSDIYYNYEISNDFKQVLIYETYNTAYQDPYHDKFEETCGNIVSLIGLYQNIKKGHSIDIHKAVKFITPDG